MGGETEGESEVIVQEMIDEMLKRMAEIEQRLRELENQ
jgi:hypothetical protein